MERQSASAAQVVRLRFYAGLSVEQTAQVMGASDVRQRVALFIDVCHDIQHAHTKGILHRDLKPSNILVTTIDGRAVVKVIDSRCRAV